MKICKENSINLNIFCFLMKFLCTFAKLRYGGLHKIIAIVNTKLLSVTKNYQAWI